LGKREAMVGSKNKEQQQQQSSSNGNGNNCAINLQ
jgi:hypothetical protein